MSNFLFHLFLLLFSLFHLKFACGAADFFPLGVTNEIALKQAIALHAPEAPGGDAMSHSNETMLGVQLATHATWLAVGFPRSDACSSNASLRCANSGAVDVYHFSSSANQWQFHVRLKAPNDSETLFGKSIDLNE